MNPSRVKWGVLFILVGLVFLANNLGYLSWWVWLDLLQLWPVLLIAIGLEVIIRKSKLRSLGYLSTLLIVAAFAWVIFEEHDYGYRDDSPAFSTSEVSEKYQQERSAEFDVSFADGRLSFAVGGDDLIRAVARDSKNGIHMETKCTGDHCRVEITPKGRFSGHWISINSGDNRWRCYINPQVLSRFTLNLEETELRFNADEFNVDTLRVDASRSNLVLKFGRQQEKVYAELNGSHSDVDLYFPDSVGIKLEGEYPDQNDIEQFHLTDRGGYLANDLYDQAPVNVRVKSDLRSGKIRLNRL